MVRAGRSVPVRFDESRRHCGAEEDEPKATFSLSFRRDLEMGGLLTFPFGLVRAVVVRHGE